ncbi:hypothetical protein Agub_g429, partial [Astrephomene gubernaculifera]
MRSRIADPRQTQAANDRGHTLLRFGRRNSARWSRHSVRLIASHAIGRQTPGGSTSNNSKTYDYDEFGADDNDDSSSSPFYKAYGKPAVPRGGADPAPPPRTPTSEARMARMLDLLDEDARDNPDAAALAEVIRAKQRAAEQRARTAAISSSAAEASRRRAAVENYLAGRGLGSISSFRELAEEELERTQQELEEADLAALETQVAAVGADLEADWAAVEGGRTTTGWARTAAAGGGAAGGGGRGAPADGLLAPPSNPQVQRLRAQAERAARPKKRRTLFEPAAGGDSSDDSEDDADYRYGGGGGGSAAVQKSLAPRPALPPPLNPFLLLPKRPGDAAGGGPTDLDTLLDNLYEETNQPDVVPPLSYKSEDDKYDDDGYDEYGNRRPGFMDAKERSADYERKVVKALRGALFGPDGKAQLTAKPERKGSAPAPGKAATTWPSTAPTSRPKASAPSASSTPATDYDALMDLLEAVGEDLERDLDLGLDSESEGGNGRGTGTADRVLQPPPVKKPQLLTRPSSVASGGGGGAVGAGAVAKPVLTGSNTGVESRGKAAGSLGSSSSSSNRSSSSMSSGSGGGSAAAAGGLADSDALFLEELLQGDMFADRPSSTTSSGRGGLGGLTDPWDILAAEPAVAPPAAAAAPGAWGPPRPSLESKPVPRGRMLGSNNVAAATAAGTTASASRKPDLPAKDSGNRSSSSGGGKQPPPQSQLQQQPAASSFSSAQAQLRARQEQDELLRGSWSMYEDEDEDEDADDLADEDLEDEVEQHEQRWRQGASTAAQPKPQLLARPEKHVAAPPVRDSAAAGAGPRGSSSNTSTRGKKTAEAAAAAAARLSTRDLESLLADLSDSDNEDSDVDDVDDDLLYDSLYGSLEADPPALAATPTPPSRVVPLARPSRQAARPAAETVAETSSRLPSITGKLPSADSAADAAVPAAAPKSAAQAALSAAGSDHPPAPKATAAELEAAMADAAAVLSNPSNVAKLGRLEGKMRLGAPPPRLQSATKKRVVEARKEVDFTQEKLAGAGGYPAAAADEDEVEGDENAALWPAAVAGDSEAEGEQAVNRREGKEEEEEAVEGEQPSVAAAAAAAALSGASAAGRATAAELQAAMADAAAVLSNPSNVAKLGRLEGKMRLGAPPPRLLSTAGVKKPPKPATHRAVSETVAAPTSPPPGAVKAGEAPGAAAAGRHHAGQHADGTHSGGFRKQEARKEVAAEDEVAQRYHPEAVVAVTDPTAPPPDAVTRGGAAATGGASASELEAAMADAAAVLSNPTNVARLERLEGKMRLGTPPPRPPPGRKGTASDTTTAAATNTAAVAAATAAATRRPPRQQRPRSAAIGKTLADNVDDVMVVAAAGEKETATKTQQQRQQQPRETSAVTGSGSEIQPPQPPSAAPSAKSAQEVEQAAATAAAALRELAAAQRLRQQQQQEQHAGDSGSSSSSAPHNSDNTAANASEAAAAAAVYTARPARRSMRTATPDPAPASSSSSTLTASSPPTSSNGIGNDDELPVGRYSPRGQQHQRQQQQQRHADGKVPVSGGGYLYDSTLSAGPGGGAEEEERLAMGFEAAERSIGAAYWGFEQRGDWQHRRRRAKQREGAFRYLQYGGGEDGGGYQTSFGSSWEHDGGYVGDQGSNEPPSRDAPKDDRDPFIGLPYGGVSDDLDVLNALAAYYGASADDNFGASQWKQEQAGGSGSAGRKQKGGEGAAAGASYEGRGKAAARGVRAGRGRGGRGGRGGAAVTAAAAVRPWKPGRAWLAPVPLPGSDGTPDSEGAAGDAAGAGVTEADLDLWYGKPAGINPRKLAADEELGQGKSDSPGGAAGAAAVEDFDPNKALEEAVKRYDTYWGLGGGYSSYGSKQGRQNHRRSSGIGYRGPQERKYVTEADIDAWYGKPAGINPRDLAADEESGQGKSDSLGRPEPEDPVWAYELYDGPASKTPTSSGYAGGGDAEPQQQHEPQRPPQQQEDAGSPQGRSPQGSSVPEASKRQEAAGLAAKEVSHPRMGAGESGSGPATLAAGAAADSFPDGDDDGPMGQSGGFPRRPVVMALGVEHGEWATSFGGGDGGGGSRGSDSPASPLEEQQQQQDGGQQQQQDGGQQQQQDGGQQQQQQGFRSEQEPQGRSQLPQGQPSHEQDCSQTPSGQFGIDQDIGELFGFGDEGPLIVHQVAKSAPQPHSHSNSNSNSSDGDGDGGGLRGGLPLLLGLEGRAYQERDLPVPTGNSADDEVHESAQEGRPARLSHAAPPEEQHAGQEKELRLSPEDGSWEEGLARLERVPHPRRSVAAPSSTHRSLPTPTVGSPATTSSSAAVPAFSSQWRNSSPTPLLPRHPKPPQPQSHPSRDESMSSFNGVPATGPATATAGAAAAAATPFPSAFSPSRAQPIQTHSLNLLRKLLPLGELFNGTILSYDRSTHTAFVDFPYLAELGVRQPVSMTADQLLGGRDWGAVLRELREGERPMGHLDSGAAAVAAANAAEWDEMGAAVAPGTGSAAAGGKEEPAGLEAGGQVRKVLAAVTHFEMLRSKAGAARTEDRDLRVEMVEVLQPQTLQTMQGTVRAMVRIAHANNRPLVLTHVLSLVPTGAYCQLLVEGENSSSDSNNNTKSGNPKHSRSYNDSPGSSYDGSSSSSSGRRGGGRRSRAEARRGRSGRHVVGHSAADSLDGMPAVNETAAAAAAADRYPPSESHGALRPLLCFLRAEAMAEPLRAVWEESVAADKAERRRAIIAAASAEPDPWVTSSQHTTTATTLAPPIPSPCPSPAPTSPSSPTLPLLLRTGDVVEAILSHGHSNKRASVAIGQLYQCEVQSIPAGLAAGAAGGGATA